jgi:hypothetical protein
VSSWSTQRDLCNASKEEKGLDDGRLRREAEYQALDTHRDRPVEDRSGISEEGAVKDAQRDRGQEMVQDNMAHLRVGWHQEDVLALNVSVDAAGNRSGCSSPPITFTYDALAPTAPVLTTVNPASPSRNPMPSIGGRAEATAAVDRLPEWPVLGRQLEDLVVGSRERRADFSRALRLAAAAVAHDAALPLGDRGRVEAVAPAKGAGRALQRVPTEQHRVPLPSGYCMHAHCRHAHRDATVRHRDIVIV